MPVMETLTPNHLLTLRQEPVLPPGIFVSQDNYSRQRWRQVQYMADIFCKRWMQEYLPLLQRRSKWVSETRDFRSGDVVLLVEDSPRNCWPLVRILVVHRSDDGHVRSMMLKTRDSSSVLRPVSKICLLESTAEDLNWWTDEQCCYVLLYYCIWLNTDVHECLVRLVFDDILLHRCNTCILYL